MFPWRTFSISWLLKEKSSIPSFRRLDLFLYFWLQGYRTCEFRFANKWNKENTCRILQEDSFLGSKKIGQNLAYHQVIASYRIVTGKNSSNLLNRNVQWIYLWITVDWFVFISSSNFKCGQKRNSLRTIPCASPGEKVYSIFKLVFAMYCLFILYTAERCWEWAVWIIFYSLLAAYLQIRNHDPHWVPCGSRSCRKFGILKTPIMITYIYEHILRR